MSVLVSKQFRYLSGAPVKGVTVVVVLRGTNTAVATVTTDGVGNASLYLDPGQYDWLYQGYRSPFDVLAPGSSTPTPPYIHVQSVAAATWTINHGRNSKPPVVIELDEAPDEPVWTDTSYPDLNTVVLTLPTAMSGKAYIP